MKRGTAAKVILGKDTLMDVPAGIVHGTDVILGGKAGLLNDFGGLVLSNNLMIGKKVSRGTITTVTVRGQSPLVLPDAIAGSLQAVKAFGGTEQSNLPFGYTQQQFIYMLDNSCLLTDIVPTYDCKIEFDFRTTSITPNGMPLLGGRTVTYGGLYFVKGGGGTFIVDAFGTSSDDRYSSTVSSVANKRYKFTYDNQVATLESDGSVLFTNTMTGTSANGAALVLNGLNDNGATNADTRGIYVYSFKAWDNQGNLIADYVPAIQQGTVPVVGFYDTVSGTFKTATEGTFAAGGAAVPTPDAPIDIISNNGILKVSPNLFNKATVSKYTLLNTSTGETIPQQNEWSWCSDFIPVTPDTAYYFKSGANYNVRIFEYTEDKSYTSTSYTVRNAAFTVGSTCKFIRFHIGYSTGGQAMYEGETMISLGSTALPYKPYGIYTDGTVETIQTQHQLELPTTNTYGNITSTYTYSYNASADTVAVPVTIGKQYIIEWTNTTQSTVGTVFRYGFVSDSTPSGQAITQCYRGTIQDLPSNPIIVTADNSFLLLQCNQNYTAPNITNGYLTVTEADTATAEMLLKVGNYQDEQEILSGVVTRNVGIKVLDGTESWGASGAYTGSCYTQLSPATSGTYTTIFVTHFMGKTSEGGYSVGSALYNRRNLSLWLSNSTTPTTLKSWLAQQYNAGTPVIVLYPLATSTTESVTGQTLQVVDGDNTLEITQASLNDLELEATYQSLVRLTIQEVENANLNNNVEVTIS